MSRPLTVTLPSPGTKRTRATECLRRPVPAYSTLANELTSYSLTAKFVFFWFLCFMWMLASSIHVKFLACCATEWVLRKHAFDGVFQEAYRVFVSKISCRDGFDPTYVSGVSVVHFILCFVTTQSNFLSVDDDYVVTCINVRCACWFVLASKDRCNFCGKTAECLSLCIDNIPFTLNVSFVGHKCLTHFLSS